MTALLLLSLVGATLIVVHGTIFRPLQRFWPAFFSCGQCTGFWIGAAAGAGELVTTGHGRVLDALIVGSAVSLGSLLTNAVLLNLLGDPNEEKS